MYVIIATNDIYMLQKCLSSAYKFRFWRESFQSFDFERTRWGLFQKRVVRTKFDIYVFIKTVMANSYTIINKTNNYLWPQQQPPLTSTHWTYNIPHYMPLGVKVMVWDRYKNVTVLKHILGSKPYCYTAYPSEALGF